MEHLSEWHDLTPSDRDTYPKVDAPLQVQYDNGGLFTGYRDDFFPREGHLLSDSRITCWRLPQGPGREVDWSDPQGRFNLAYCSSVNFR